MEGVEWGGGETGLTLPQEGVPSLFLPLTPTIVRSISFPRSIAMGARSDSTHPPALSENQAQKACVPPKVVSTPPSPKAPSLSGEASAQEIGNQPERGGWGGQSGWVCPAGRGGRGGTWTGT